MFENGSLLRRRKRFKLHKPDKELLKSELQALASSMPPPHSNEPTGSGCSSATTGSTGGLSAANLHRLREDLLRWEMQERRMMVAAASTASSAFPLDGVPGAETTPGYYLLSPEARQRLTGTLNDGGDVSTSPYEVAALLQTSSWAFSGLNSSAYMTHLPTYLQTSSVRQSAALLAAELPESPVSAHLCNRRNNPLTSLSLRERDRHDRSRLVDNENNQRSLIALNSASEAVSAEAFRDSSLYDNHAYRERLSGEDETISCNSSRNDVIYRDSSSPAASISPILTKTYGPTDSIYRPTSSPRSSPNYADPSDLVNGIDLRSTETSPCLRNSSESSCHSNSAALQLTIGSRIGKKTKKPFTIENIIAPDEESGNPRNLEHRELLRAPTAAKTTAAILQMPRPMYAGYPLPITGSGIHRPPYGAATWSATFSNESNKQRNLFISSLLQLDSPNWRSWDLGDQIIFDPIRSEPQLEFPAIP